MTPWQRLRFDPDDVDERLAKLTNAPADTG